MDEALDNGAKRKNLIIIGAVLFIVVVLIFVGLSLLRKPALVSPLPEDETGDVRVIFVTPEPSVEVEASATPSATPKGSPKASPKATPQTKASPKATPAGSPTSTPAGSPKASSSPSSSTSPSPTP